MESDKKRIDSPTDVAVLLDGPLRDAYVYLESGEAPIYLCWQFTELSSVVGNADVKLIDGAFIEPSCCSPPVRWPLLKTFARENLKEDLEGVRKLEWIEREVRRLAPHLHEAFFSRGEYFVLKEAFNYARNRAEDRRRELEGEPGRVRHVRLHRVEQVEVLVEEPLRRAYRLLREGTVNYVCLYWNTDHIDAIGFVRPGFEDLDPYARAEFVQTLLSIHGGNPDERFLTSTLSEDAWVEHVLPGTARRAYAHLIRRDQRHISKAHIRQAQTASTVAFQLSSRRLDEPAPAKTLN